MTNQIQSLESRVFLSASPVTAAMLNADKAAVLAQAATIKADAKTAFGNQKIQGNAIAAAYKLLPAADKALLKTLNLDSIKSGTTLTQDVNALVNASSTLAKKSAAIGVSLLSKVTAASLAAAQKDIVALNAVTQVPLSKLQSFFSSSKLAQDRALIVAAFPEATALLDAVIAEETSATANQTTILGEAVQYQTDIATLATDLTSVRTAVGTLPNIVGTFSGTAIETSGKQKGQSAATTLIITSEDSGTGKVTGTVTDVTTGAADTVTGVVGLNGKITLVATSSTSKGLITGQVNGTTITGKVKFANAAGTFSVLEV